MLKSVARAGALVVGVLGAVAATAGSAQAEVGQPDGALVARASTVVVKASPGDPITSGSYTIAVPPKCWWETIPVNFDLSGDFNADDPTAFQEWYDEQVKALLPHAHAAAGYYALPSVDEVKRIVKLEREGQDYTWYRLGSQEGVNCAEEGFADTTRTYGEAYGGQAGDLNNQDIPISYAAFPAAQDPPPPLVDVKDLTERLWDEVSQQVADPEVDRNPTIDTMGGATLVNLDTWFWVTNVVDALAEDGNIHLEASIPGTPVRTTIDVDTTGVDITSPSGATQCAIEQAKQAYAAGVADSQACTISFAKANRGGWPVTSSIVWSGTWEGVDNDGTDGGTLTLARSSTDAVPVGESQALVRKVG